MCTVSYIPKGEHDFILTSNRDEGVNRKASSGPWEKEHAGIKYLYPIDEEAGGTWIAIAGTGKIYCLLNGAFEAHEKKANYRKSRGVVFLDLLQDTSIKYFNDNYNLVDIEPFTIVAIEGIDTNKRSICEFRWDGETKYLKKLNHNKPAIWSSSPLYPQHVQEMRESWFFDWFKGNQDPKAFEVLKLHRFGGNAGLENNFYMDRGFVKTVSITQILCKSWGYHMEHRNLVTHEKKHRYLDPQTDKEKLQPKFQRC